MVKCDRNDEYGYQKRDSSLREGANKGKHK